MVMPLKSLWTDTCDITVRESELDTESGQTLFREVCVASGVPCRISFRLSFETVSGVKASDIASSVTQTVKLFLSTDILIPPGSKITVFRNGRTFAFAQSGAAAVFSAHQEVRLERFRKWA